MKNQLVPFTLIAASFGLLLFFVSCNQGVNSTGVVENEPGIADFSPKIGPPGTQIVISGGGFSATDADNVVKFGDFTADTVLIAGRNKITTLVPEGADDGPVGITVSVNGNTMSSDSTFVIEIGAPGIASIEPGSGFIGDEITITGMNFGATAAENTVAFNGTEAEISSASETELVVEVPEGATDGPVEVTAREQIAQSADDFDVITSGTVQAEITTTGSSLDDNGYTITVDGAAFDTSAVSDTTFTIPDLEQGDHSIGIDTETVRPTCELSGDNPRNVSITPGDTINIAFEVICETPPVGTVEVTTSTTGVQQDSDGYTVSAGGESTDISSNGMASITNVPNGQREVELTGIASNCFVDGDNPVSVEVPTGGSSAVSFDVVCEVPNLIPFNGFVEFDAPMGENGWRLPFGGGSVTVSDERSRSGSQSFKVEIPDGTAAPKWNTETSVQFDGEVEFDNAFDTEEGTEYKISAWFYVESGAPGASGGEWQMSIRVQPADGFSDSPKLFVALADIEVGEWVLREGTFIGQDLTNKVQLGFVQSEFTNNTVIFIDDVKVTKVNQ